MKLANLLLLNEAKVDIEDFNIYTSLDFMKKLTAEELTRLLEKTGYKDMVVVKAKFSKVLYTSSHSYMYIVDYKPDGISDSVDLKNQKLFVGFDKKGFVSADT